jgi:hypothetical protein
MNRESYEYYLQLLKIPRNASEEVIRAAIVREQRHWTGRVNSHKLEVRQQAERMVAALDGAGETLLGPDRELWVLRYGQSDDSLPSGQADITIEPELIAKAIEQVATARGRRSQERKGTAIYKRAAFFYKGIDYLLEELTHKKYQAELDFKRCCAFRNAQPLFDWHCRPLENSGRGNIKTHMPGSWVTDLIAMGHEIDQADGEA